jgi:two-component system, LuxR family, response regulator DctR
MLNTDQYATVHLIDDDAGVRDALAWLLRSRRLLCQSHASAEDFLQALDAHPEWQHESACLLLDVRMPGMSGLALFDQLLTRRMTEVWPVIFLTGHADVPTAVDAVKRGAFDFCEKPFSDNALVDRIEQALALSRQRTQAAQLRASLQLRINDLTERERVVMQLVVDGVPNKQIADRLDISVRTVEVHRAKVFDKMEVKSAVELANALRGL